MDNSKNFPYKHNQDSTQLPADQKLQAVTRTKSREYMLQMLNLPGDTVISTEQLTEQFDAIVKNVGI